MNHPNATKSHLEKKYCYWTGPTSNSTSPKKEWKEHSTDRLILTHPIKSLQRHPCLELRDGFGIPVNKIFGPLLPQYESSQCHKVPSLNKILLLDWATSNSTSPKKEWKEHSTDRLILTHPIKSLQHHTTTNFGTDSEFL